MARSVMNSWPQKFFSFWNLGSLPMASSFFSHGGRKWPNGATGFTSTSLPNLLERVPLYWGFVQTSWPLNQLLCHFWDTCPIGQMNWKWGVSIFLKDCWQTLAWRIWNGCWADSRRCFRCLYTVKASFLPIPSHDNPKSFSKSHWRAGHLGSLL